MSNTALIYFHFKVINLRLSSLIWTLSNVRSFFCIQCLRIQRLSPTPVIIVGFACVQPKAKKEKKNYHDDNNVQWRRIEAIYVLKTTLTHHNNVTINQVSKNPWWSSRLRSRTVLLFVYSSFFTTFLSYNISCFIYRYNIKLEWLNLSIVLRRTYLICTGTMALTKIIPRGSAKFGCRHSRLV